MQSIHWSYKSSCEWAYFVWALPTIEIFCISTPNLPINGPCWICVYIDKYEPTNLQGGLTIRSVHSFEHEMTDVPWFGRSYPSFEVLSGLGTRTSSFSVPHKKLSFPWNWPDPRNTAFIGSCPTSRTDHTAHHSRIADLFRKHSRDMLPFRPKTFRWRGSK